MTTMLNALGAKCAATVRAAVRAGAVTLTAAALAPAAHAQAEALKPFKNFFVTGDYVATGVTLGGTGIGGFATGELDVGTHIPAGAEVVAAYLYWTTVGPSDAIPASLVAGAQFRKNDLAGSAVLVGREVNDAARCGGNWRFSTSRAMYVFRADVLRFFPRVRPSDPTQPVTVGFRGRHEVRLPDGGEDTTKAATLGAGLVLVYRQAGFDASGLNPVAPLRSIVIYEGAATLDSRKAIQTSTMRGFYEASQTAPAARLSMLVSQGLPNTGETVTLQSTVDGTGTVTVATDPFVGGSARRQPGYDAVTFENVALEKGAMQARVALQAGPSQQLECLTWSTSVLSTNVQDTDLDGLLDVWESRDAWERKPDNLQFAYSSWPLVEPNGTTTLPNLAAMGADPLVQDLFVEIDYLAGADRSHAPSRESLKLVAGTFRQAAPRPSLVERGLCPANALPGQCPINVHFDVGSLYQPSGVTMESCRTQWSAECAFIPTSAGTRGGDRILERQCVDPAPNDGVTICPFPNVPGTVGWKNGFRAYRDGLVDPVTRQPCARGQAGCEPRFLRNRKDIFRYALFARALGVPSPSDPTQPRRSSGIADSGGGGDLLVTLGLWGDKQGLTFVEASTLTHELGHTLGLRHGGVLPNRTIGTNCRPNYQSVMNYLFQIGGVRDRTTGEPLIDFSRSALPFYDEGAGLSEAAGIGAADYLARWYAPRQASFLDEAVGTTPATRYCDGTPLPANAGAPVVRIDSTPRAAARGVALDWNGDGDLLDAPRIDANYDGLPGSSGPGVNDFATMDLRQVGARRSIGSERLSRSVVDPVTGRPIPPTSLPIGGGFSLDAQPNLVALGYGDLGYGDLGYGDLGYGDLGYGDLGYGDLGYGDLGYGDLGYGDLGYGDLGYGDLGYGDLGYGDLGVPLEAPSGGIPPLGTGEITLEAALATVAPPVVTATVVEPGPFVLLSWNAPTVGRVLEYRVYRVLGADVTAANTANGELVLLARLTETPGSPPVPPPTEISDSLLLSGTYTYFVVAVLANPDDPNAPLVSGASNFATVTVTTSSTCARRLVDIVARDGFASVPFPGDDPGPRGTGLRLNAMGELARVLPNRRTQTGQVWQLRNTASTSRSVSFGPARGGGVVSLTLQPDSELYYWTSNTTTRHELTFNGTVQDAKDPSPSRFAISRPVRDTACR
jgi:hypothetical protein